LETLLTIVLLVTFWGDETKIADGADARARAAQQQAFEESARSQCLALDGTPDCRFYLQEQLRELEEQLCDGKCQKVLPIPGERQHPTALMKTSG
jgi:hypothetical protein